MNTLVYSLLYFTTTLNLYMVKYQLAKLSLHNLNIIMITCKVFTLNFAEFKNIYKFKEGKV